jgi:hypothetical protein
MIHEAERARWPLWPFGADARRAGEQTSGMRFFLRSPIPYALVTIVAGLLALGPAAVIGIDAGRGMDAFAGLMLLVSLPLAVGGLLAISGGVLILRRKSLGRILATIGLGIAALHPVISSAYKLSGIGACGPLASDCANQWYTIIVGFGGAGVIGYLIAAMWVVRHAPAGGVKAAT